MSLSCVCKHRKDPSSLPIPPYKRAALKQAGTARKALVQKGVPCKALSSRRHPACAAQAEKVQERQFEEPAKEEAQGTQETEDLNRPVGPPEKEPVKEEEKSTAVPVELLRKSEQHAQSPKSAYA